MVRLEGHTIATQVTFAEEGEPPLLGMVTLEGALLAVDPVGQRLIPVDVERLQQQAGRSIRRRRAAFRVPRTKVPADPTGA